MKYLCLLLTFTCSTFFAEAQSFRFGLKGGANYSDINGKSLTDDQHHSRLTWHAGGMVNIQYPGNTYFSIQPEIIYSRKGYENTGPTYEVRDEFDQVLYEAQESGFVKLNYIDVPVMFNFKSGIIIFEVGPQFSLLVNVRNDASITQTSPDGTFNTVSSPRRFANKGTVNKIDAGFATGFRLETQNGVGLGLRFNQGFIKIPTHSSGADGSKPLAPRANNQVFQLFVSYLIPE